jgi:hypothetical protein
MSKPNDSTVLIMKQASLWLCQNGRTEFEGYVRSISPLGFTAALCAREPSATDHADLTAALLGRKFAAAICGRDYSTIVEANATDVQALSGSRFDFNVTCRFVNLDTDQKRMIVGLIIEHYAPRNVAM